MHDVSGILIVTVNKYETQTLIAEVAKATGTRPKTIAGDERIYRELGVINGTRIFHALSGMGSGGLSGSQMSVHKAIKTLEPCAVIAVGIAYGVDRIKQKIGEILLSTQLRPYDLKRVGKNKIVLRDDRPPAASTLVDFFMGFVEFAWEGVRVHPGLLLTGDELVDNLAHRKSLQELEPEAIGGEMEGAGIYTACADHKVDWIVIKAICDWADGKKSHNKRARQIEAARNSAHFLVEALSSIPLPESYSKSTTSSTKNLKTKEDPIPPVVLKLDSNFKLRMTPEETKCFIKEIEYRFDERLSPILVPEGSLDNDPKSAPRIDKTDILRLNKKRKKTLEIEMYGLPYLLKLAKTWGLSDEEQKVELVHNWCELLRSPDTYINHVGKDSVVGQLEIFCHEPYYSVRVTITDDHLQEMDNGKEFFATLALASASVFDMPESVRLFALPVVIFELAKYQANQALEENYQKLLYANWYVVKP